MNSRRIDSDKSRFIDMVKGDVRKELRKAVKNGEILGKKDGEVISIPIPYINQPRIRYGKHMEGVGQGEGEKGDVIDDGEGEEGGAGDAAGDHIYEEFKVGDVLDLYIKDLELPRLKKKKNINVYTTTSKLKTRSLRGPMARLDKKRTYRKAIKRQMSSPDFKPFDLIYPARPDRVFKSFKEEPAPEDNALLLYLMDVSGSMGEEQKKKVRIMNLLIDRFVRSQYKAVDSRYLIHDAVAREVTRKQFYTTKESGGTIISTGYQLCKEIMNKDYNSDEWNIYIIHSSDGDNWTDKDNKLTVEIIKNDLEPYCNMICYAQVKSPYGSGKFINVLKDEFDVDNLESIVQVATIEDNDGIELAIKHFFGRKE